LRNSLRHGPQDCWQGITLAFVASGSLYANETLTISEAGFGSEVFVSPGPVVATAPGNVFGDWTLNVSATGVNVGTFAAPDIDLSGSVDTLVTAPGALTITFAETGFTAFPLEVFNTVGGTNNHTNSAFTALYSPPVNTVISGLGYSSSAAAFSNTSGVTSITPGAVPYTLIERAVVSSTGTATSHIESFDVELQSITTPEPGLYALTGAGLLGLLAFVARRRKRSEGLVS
jgi:hypothetical protein